MFHTKQTKTPPTQLPFRFPLNGVGLRRSFFAFTLVELIVVIVILVILATIAFLSFNSYSGKARDSNRLSNLKLSEKGIELYFVNAGTYPTPEGTISTGTVNGLDVAYNGVVGDRISNLVKLSTTPKDPLTNDYIDYGLTSDKTKYQLAITLEDSTSTSYNNSNYFDNIDNNIFEKVNADTEYQAKVIGNYLGSLRFSSGSSSSKNYYIANIPSLIYNSSTQTNTSVDLLSGSSTFFVINKNTNLPYRIATSDTPNKKDGTTLVREVTNSQTAVIGAIDITAIVTATDAATKNSLIASTFSGANLTNFGGDINVITSVVTGNGGSSSSSSGGGGGAQVIAGVCGSNNGLTLSAIPSTNLCSTGTGSSVLYNTGAGAYSWSCVAGTTVSCKANDNKTILLIHGEETIGGSTFTESSPSGKNVTNYGVTQNSSTKKFGASSLSFTGIAYSAIPTSADWDFGNGDFTIEMWLNLNSLTTYTHLITRWVTTNNYDFNFRIAPNGANYRFELIQGVTGETATFFNSNNITLTMGTWNHIAVVRNGSTITFYVNGVSAGTAAISTAFPAHSSNINIGRQENSPTTYMPNGYMDEIRVSKGIARRTADFSGSLPTSPY